jgi:ferredoxin
MTEGAAVNRNIIRIDETKCTGCGLCVPNCAEGSHEIRNGKAVLVKEALCDGLGACLGHCPEGALLIEERDADDFDEHLVEQRLRDIGRPAATHPGAPAHACPSTQMLHRPSPEAPSPAEGSAGQASELSQWPVQLALLPPTAPFFRGADLVLTADCVPLAYPAFHRDFLRGRAVAIACPKLDNGGAHFQKLIQLFQQGGLKSVTVLRMEVPCCGGLSAMAIGALKESGSSIPLREVVIGRDGSLLSERTPEAEAA